MSEQADPQPTSFSFRLLAGEALSYRGGSTTPPRSSGYLVSVTTQPITNELVQPWLKESLLPLIGPEAVAFLEQYAGTPEAQQFLTLVTTFRQTLE
jgi:hypothetical protein